MMIYFKANNTEYPASIAGKITDRDWGNRESKAVTLTATYEQAAQLFTDGLVWSVVEKQPDEDGTEQTMRENDCSGYCVAGPITDNRDGTCTCKMGKKTASDVLAELEATYDGN